MIKSRIKGVKIGGLSVWVVLMGYLKNAKNHLN